MATPGTAHQLGFFVGSGLVVHPTQGAFFLVERDVALYQPWIQSPRFELLLVPSPGKEAAFVSPHFGFDNERASQLRLHEDHSRTSFESGTGVRASETILIFQTILLPWSRDNIARTVRKVKSTNKYSYCS